MEEVRYQSGVFNHAIEEKFNWRPLLSVAFPPSAATH
jgi:hypothetical protein